MTVHCFSDPDWVLDVLRSAAPTLEELRLAGPREEHLRVVHAMPRLQRMDLDVCDKVLDIQPPELPALPLPSKLKWLRVSGLPRATLVSLLRAHNEALEELWIDIDTPFSWTWPEYSNDLDVLLDQCGLRVRHVVLGRDGDHSKKCCEAQVAAVRGVLPQAIVSCEMCHGVPARDMYPDRLRQVPLLTFM